MDEKKSSLKKYLFPSIGGFLFAAFWIVLGIAGVGVVAVPGGYILMMLAFAALSAVPNIVTIVRMNNRLRELEGSGRLERVLQEFDTGKQFLSDKLRLGPTYIIGKKSGNIFAYGEIRKIYQYVHKTNFAEDRRELRVETTEGKTRTVCRLPLRGAGDQELMQIIAIVRVMNPNVHIGYK